MYNNECGSPSSPSSLKHKIKSSICCFRSPPHELEEPLDYRHRQPRSASCFCRKTQPHEALETKDGRCRGLFARISARNRKRPYSADFRYDPLSYAQNFEDDACREDEFPLSFSSRLPHSPNRSSEAPMVAAMPREIVAYT
ncbi:hypothetical protein ACOSP7_008088 [Xanthoceras sorbifolium]|uniref:Uncharacterized protein n=1 Tax=Xanthoceras sorbifolium TaxID=99658 RepID=A0ABQ8ICA0_9ROSI|nr:hypothetical protein JRO89_XS03G0250300 [Xanthoceras sorbifolium]